MLATALRVDAVALTVLMCYAFLHVSQNVDAWQSGSLAFAAAVRHNQWLLFVSALCLGVLLYIVFLWVVSPPAKFGKSSIEDAHCERIQFANALCAGIGLLGAPIVIPCLVACILVQATRVSLQTGEATKNADIFFVARGDRFDDAW